MTNHTTPTHIKKFLDKHFKKNIATYNERPDGPNMRSIYAMLCQLKANTTRINAAEVIQKTTTHITDCIKRGERKLRHDTEFKGMYKEARTYVESQIEKQGLKRPNKKQQKPQGYPKYILTTAQKKYIDDNAESMFLIQMARNLKIGITPVREYAKSNGLERIPKYDYPKKKKEEDLSYRDPKWIANPWDNKINPVTMLPISHLPVDGKETVYDYNFLMDKRL